VRTPTNFTVGVGFGRDSLFLSGSFPGRLFTVIYPSETPQERLNVSTVIYPSETPQERLNVSPQGHFLRAPRDR